MVFDNAILEKQGPIEKCICQGHRGGTDCLYLMQNYFHIPKQSIWDNANLIILFNQDTKIFQVIHYTFIGEDMPFAEFYEFFNECIAQPYRFCTYKPNIKTVWR